MSPIFSKRQCRQSTRQRLSGRRCSNLLARTIAHWRAVWSRPRQPANRYLRLVLLHSILEARLSVQDHLPICPLSTPFQDPSRVAGRSTRFLRQLHRRLRHKSMLNAARLQPVLACCEAVLQTLHAMSLATHRVGPSLAYLLLLRPLPQSSPKLPRRHLGRLLLAQLSAHLSLKQSDLQEKRRQCAVILSVVVIAG